MLTVFGSVALDTTRTPFKTETNILGGAATFASLCSSFFTPTSTIAVVGSDFPNQYRKILNSRVDTRGIVTKKDGKTFHYDSSFDYDFHHRTSIKTELNVIKDFKPVVPEAYVSSDYIYLGNNDPSQNIAILQYFTNPKFIVCDTIEYWIVNKRKDVIEMISKVNGVVINDEEARILCRTANLIKCAKIILSWGPGLVVIKKGEHGSLLVLDNIIFPASAFPIEEMVDPTGAGDSFAGAFMGYLSYKKDLTIERLKEAVIYGNVLGAYAIEDFGVNKLLEITKVDIDYRYEMFRRITQF